MQSAGEDCAVGGRRLRPRREKVAASPGKAKQVSSRGRKPRAMNREEFAIGLVLSLPVAAGVAVGVLRQTLGSWPVVSLVSGLVAGGLVFGVVWLATTTEPTQGRPEAVERVAERVVPEPRAATPSDLLLGAGVGALVTVFLWYIPLSPILGGITAGFLQGGSRDDARTAGLLSGALVPLVVVVVAVVAFLVAGSRVFGRFPFGPVVALLVSLAGIVYAVGLGTIGGWLGGVLLEDERAVVKG